MIERWEIEIPELHQIIFDMNLPVYNKEYKLEKEIIYEEAENQDDFPWKDILKKNILWEFDDLLQRGLYAKTVGAYGVLSRMFFKVEDIEAFEKKHFYSDHSMDEDEFKIFDSIVNGEMRPFLEKYASKSHIKKLHNELYRVSYSA